MAEDVTKSLSLTLIHGSKKYDINLQLPSSEAGDALSVKHLTDRVFELTDIPAEAQRLIFKGKSLKDQKEELHLLGLKNGAKVMLIGKKPVPDDDEDAKALVQIENKIEKHAKLLSDITHELDGIHRGFLDKSKQPEAIRQKEKQMAHMDEELMKLLEKLDSLQFEETNKGGRGKRKTLVDKIHVLQKRIDGLTRGLEEGKEKIGDNPS